MADESSVAAGKRFSRDMRLIREDRDISIDALHKETRISRTLIESFEQGGLYEHSTFNEVYLRSFVRAYAEVIDISSEQVLEGLNAALEGTYEDALAQEYLGSTPVEDANSSQSAESEASTSKESDQPPSATPAAGGPEGRGGIVGPPRALGAEDQQEEEAERQTTSEAGAEEESTTEQDSDPTESKAGRRGGDTEEPPSPSDSEERPFSGPSSGHESGAEAQTSPDEETTEERPQDRSDDVSDSTGDVPSWMEDQAEEDDGDPPSPDRDAPSSGATLSGAGEDAPAPDASGDMGIVGEPTAVGGQDAPPEPPRPDSSPASATAGARRQTGWLQFLRGEKQEMIWASIGIVVVLVVLIGLGIAYFSSTTSAEQKTTDASAPDTAAAPATEDTTAAPPKPPLADLTIGDTIYLTVFAEAPVSDIRIQRDEDLQRPYWIEEGEAEVYPFQQRITLENELGDIRLFMAGYPYPSALWDTTGQIIITRSEVEAFGDTLRGSPAALSVTPDTIPKGPPNSQEQEQEQ